MTRTADDADDGVGSSQQPPAAQAQPSGPSRLVRFLIGAPRAGESDTRFGMRLALYGPLVFYLVLVALLIVLQVEGEAGLGLTLSYWLFIGVSQLIYLIPSIVVAIVISRRQVAWGMARGAGVVAILNAGAWFIGYYLIGAQ